MNLNRRAALSLKGSRASRARAARRATISTLVLAASLASPAFARAQATVEITPQVIYLHRNGTGDVVARSNADGSAVLYRADVRPFSELRVVVDQAGAPGRYLGQNREETTGPDGGLVRLGARMFAPYSGRFLSPDPLSITQFPLTNPQAFNRYSYALNNPYRYHDASGLKPQAISPADTRILMNFLRHFEGKLPRDHSMKDRLFALYDNPAYPSDPVWATNNRPIESKHGQEVDLDWGIRLAATSVSQAIAYTKGIGTHSIAKEYAALNFFVAKNGWNGLATLGTYGQRALGINAPDQVGPFSFEDPNYRAVLLLVDFIINGGDLRSYFSAEQIQQVEKLEKREGRGKAEAKSSRQNLRFPGGQEHLQ